MSKQKGDKDMPDSSSRKGLGDDQGTRVGSPTPDAAKKSTTGSSPNAQGGAAQRSNVGDQTTSSDQSTGAGSEATEGMHSADGSRSESDRTALDGKKTGTEGDEGGGG